MASTSSHLAVMRITWGSFHLSPYKQVLLPRDVLGCWKDPHGSVWFVTSPVGNLCLSVGTAGVSSALLGKHKWTEISHKATELSSWSLFFAQQCFKWHFSVWANWELLGNAASSWILLPCRLEVTEWLPQEDRERKMRKVGQSEKEKTPARLGILDLTQQGMWNTWEWWALCVADSPAANSASQQRWKEEF